MKKTNIFKCQRGASAVEFAIVLPLLLIFIFGIIEFSILFYDKAVITNASREGARTAILFDMAGSPPVPIYRTEDQVRAVVASYCSTHLINFSSSTVPTVTAPLPPVVSGTPPSRYRIVTVNFTYTFLVLPNILGAVFGGSSLSPLNLTAVTRMRTENQDT